MRGKILQSIGDRAILFVLCLFLLASGMGFGYSAFRLSQMSEDSSLRNEARNMQKAKNAVLNYVSMPFSIIEGAEQEIQNLSSVRMVFDVLATQIQMVLSDGDIPLNVKRERIMEIVGLARYGVDNAFWINDRVRVVLHQDPSLVGTMIDDKKLFAEVDGSTFLRQAARASVASEDHVAIIPFEWKAAGSQTTKARVAVVRYLPELDWFLGTSLFIDDFVTAQKMRAMNDIKNMRLPDGNYFWINDTAQPIANMVMHPTKPSLDGTALDNEVFNCAYMYQIGLDGEPVATSGKDNLFTLMVKVVLEGGEGYVWYNWPKPKQGGGATEELYPKVSYVKLFDPWGWVVGNGIYIDDIAQVVKEDKAVFDKELKHLLMDTITYGSVFILLLVGALWLFFNRSLSRPIGGVMQYADKVAHGDLDAQITGYYPCETGRLRESIQSMVQSLKTALSEAEEKGLEAMEESQRARGAMAEAEKARAMADHARVEGLREAANRLESLVRNINSASDFLRGQVENVASGMDMQNERSTETATAMEEMNATVLEVARSASEAASSSDRAKAQALDGASIVRNVAEAISDVRNRSSALRESLGDLGRKAEDIGQVMNVITDIADQTNLLALNAAIEAARAGDAGRGFAVVADEVRKLAEKTMQATKEVGVAVQSIQSETRRNIRSMEDASEAVDKSTDLAGDAGSSLEGIVSMVEASSDQVRAIATASEEQSATSEEINRSVEEISRIANNTMEGMKEAEQVINNLVDLADQLETLVKRLREE